MQTIDRPELTFGIFGVDARGRRLLVSQSQRFFGKENFDLFRAYGRKGEQPPEELKQSVDREIYAKVYEWHSAADWSAAMVQANRTVNSAHGIFFPDQEKRATMVTNIAWSDNRPSTALRILTTPTRLIGEQCKYEQGRQLGLALLCAEVMSRDENGTARAILSSINQFLESKSFIGREGDPDDYHTFSYHTPDTNRLQGLSQEYPDSVYPEGLWVKSLDFPVRKLGIRDSSREVVGSVPVLYDPREKEIEAAVIKAKERSLRATKMGSNGGAIETSPYATDQLGFRLVVMEGGRTLRDRVTSQLEDLFQSFEGFKGMRTLDRDSGSSKTDRVTFRRTYIYIEGLRNPIEMMVFSLDDWLAQEYEVGKFDPNIGMHNGPAHDLYKLEMVGSVAQYLWPSGVYGIDLEGVKKASSYDYAARLRRKQRIHPSPYLEEF